MSKQKRRGDLGRQQRETSIRTARQSLKDFLTTLDPNVRNILVDPKSVPREVWSEYWGADPQLRERVREVHTKYEQLLIQVPDEWRRYCRSQSPAYKLIREYTLLGRIPTGGAPRKPLHEHEGTFLRHRVDETERNLAKGWDLRRRRKDAGGKASGDEEIAQELSNLGYDRSHIDALLEHRTLHAAAVHVVAEETGKTRGSVAVAVSRAKRPAPAAPPPNIR